MGANSRFAGKLLRIEVGMDIAHVRQRGTGPLVQDVVAWQVLITIDGPVVLIPLIRCGALIALDATHGQRVVKLREVPAAPETLPDFQGRLSQTLGGRWPARPLAEEHEE